MVIGERAVWSNGPVLFTHSPGGDVPRVYSTDYGWSVVAQTVCTREAAGVVVEFYVGGEVVETLPIPVSFDQHSWQGTAETKSTKFEAYCNPYADSVHFTIRLKYEW